MGAVLVPVHLEEVERQGRLLSYAVTTAKSRVFLYLTGETQKFQGGADQRAAWPAVHPGQAPPPLGPQRRRHSPPLAPCRNRAAGPLAAEDPTPRVLDYLAHCYDSVARLKPTFDVVPLFPCLGWTPGEARRRGGKPPAQCKPLAAACFVARLCPFCVLGQAAVGVPLQHGCPPLHYASSGHPRIP